MFIPRSIQIISTQLCQVNPYRVISKTRISLRQLSFKNFSTKMDGPSTANRSSLQNIPIKSTQGSLNDITRYNNIIKSQQDNREYRGLVLQNGMKVLLISDTTTDFSAAALSVEIGHMSDPKDLPGLAHFCEHMLFLGTEKYPDENAYTTYLSQNGGHSNAATYPTMTKYYFEVNPDKFEGALDRFAQFFISPLFTESATEREINAVDSEHEKNVAIDTWRYQQLSKSLADPNHPYNQFGTGNKMTLKFKPEKENINVREELIKFYKKWYSANIMSLAVFGKEPLDELEKMVVSKFSEVENKNVELPEWSPQPYKPDAYATKVYIVPVKDIRTLGITFITKNLHEYYKSGPEEYISHLMGHEGTGSILSALRKKGWCNQLVSSHNNIPRGFGLFNISVDLTQDGLEHVDEIIMLIFQYIKMLQEQGPVERIFDEIKNINELVFRFKDKENPMSFVSNVVRSIQLYPLSEVLTAPHLLSEFRSDLITELLNEFVPEKCLISVVGKKFENIANEVEQWYKTKFYREQVPQKVLMQWRNCDLNSDLYLPAPNPFIPKNFDIIQEDSDLTKHPIIIYDSPILRVWHKQDNDYKRPKTCMSFDFSNPIVYADPLNCNLTFMLVQLFKDNLKEYLYDAELAGLHLGVTNTTYGITVTISGYNDKQKVLLEKVLDNLFDMKIDKQRFEILKESYYRTLKNFKTEQPYQHAVYYLALILTENAWSQNELLEAMKLVTVETLQHYMKDFFSRLHAECFIYGNVNKDKALEISEFVKKKLESTNSVILPLLARQLMQKREYKLSDGDSYLFESMNEFHKSSCVELYLQCGAQSEASMVFIDLVAQILTEPCYNLLRTQEQLGYIVFCGSRKVNGATGIRIIVQSIKDCNYVEERIENFLKLMVTQLEEMPEEEFERHKEGLASQKLEKPKKLSVMFYRYLHEITSSQYHFDRSEAEVALLRKITKPELINYYKTYIANEAPQRHALVVHIISSVEPSPDDQLAKFATKATVAADETKETTQTTLYTETEKDTAVFGNEINLSIENEQKTSNETTTTPSTIQHTKINDLSLFKSSKELYPIPRPFLDIRPKGARSKL